MDLFVFDRDSTSMCLRWSRVEGATKYRLEMRNPHDSSSSTYELSGLTVRKKNLDASLEYEWRVSANGLESETVVAGPTAKYQMNAPHVIDYDGASATVEWEEVKAASGYALQYLESSSSSWKLASDALSGTRARKKLSQGTYFFRVKPTDGEEYEFSRASSAVVVPRKSTELEAMLGPALLPRGKTSETLAGKIVALYASASW